MSVCVRERIPRSRQCTALHRQRWKWCELNNSAHTAAMAANHAATRLARASASLERGAAYMPAIGTDKNVSISPIDRSANVSATALQSFSVTEVPPLIGES